MPRLSYWFLRLSLVYLAVGFTLGALIHANKGIPFFPAIWRFLPIHFEVLLMGWTVQLALGVAFWILPRFQVRTPAGYSQRGKENLIWLALVLLNFGIGLVISETLFSINGLALAGRIVQGAGVLAFVIGSWKRVKPFAG